jgi:hypothetical protein
MSGAEKPIRSIEWVCHGELIGGTSLTDSAFLAEIRRTMSLVPLALRRTDAEICWLLRLLAPLSDGRRRGYVALSDLRTFGQEWLGVRTLDLHLALSGVWSGLIVHLEDLGEGPLELDYLLLSVLDKPASLDQQIHLSDNLYRPERALDATIPKKVLLQL